MHRIESFVLFCFYLCVVFLVGVPCAGAALALYIVLRPIRYFVDAAYERSEAKLAEEFPESDDCSSEEFRGNPASWILAVISILPLMPLEGPIEGLIESWHGLKARHSSDTTSPTSTC